MTPADGSDFNHDAPADGAIRAGQAILMHGGRSLLLFEAAGAAPPQSGHLVQRAGRVAWDAHLWQKDAAWRGVAVLDTVPRAGDLIIGDADRWRLAETPRLDVAPELLADFVRGSGGQGRAVHRFLAEMRTADADSAGDRAHRDFTQAFLMAVAEQDGFVEMIAAPDTGGVLAQGWAHSLAAGMTLLVNTDETGDPLEAEVAQFERDDILPPGRGFCCFGKFWSAESLAAAQSIFFEKDGRLLRLDVLRDAATLAGEGATAHVAQMLPRLEAPADTLGAFRRVCRPRFAGVDTLTGTAQPIAAALDALLQAPDGAILTVGWLLDPLRRVERVILKGTGSFYAQLDIDWCPLPRPDLARGFSSDPRFAGLLDERDAMYGFIAHAPADCEGIEDTQPYLELVLEDGSCLFRPLVATPFDSAERLPQVLSALSPTDPQLGRIVEGHLLPFLESVPSTPRRARTARPIPLGEPAAAAAVTALIPCRSFALLQPVLALLAGTPEADALDLCLVASRDAASDMLSRLEDAFAFYGLAGHLVIAPDLDGVAARLDHGVATSRGDRLLVWMPSALPRSSGWLGRLADEADALPVPGLLSPALSYEDGSIHFGGAPTAAVGAACALQGYATDWLPRGRPRRTPTGAAEIALIDRAALERAGGFAGRLFGDAFAHVDLADRLHRLGLGTWCSGSVEFWVLDDPEGEATATSPIVRRIDAALLERRAAAAARPSA